MKILKIVQKHYAILGIDRPTHQSNQKYPFGIRVFCGFLLYAYFIVSLLAYILYVANDFMEYIECICTVSGNMIIFVCFAAVVFRKITLFGMIDNIEKFMNTSKTELPQIEK